MRVEMYASIATLKAYVDTTCSMRILLKKVMHLYYKCYIKISIPHIPMTHWMPIQATQKTHLTNMEWLLQRSHTLQPKFVTWLVRLLVGVRLELYLLRSFQKWQINCFRQQNVGHAPKVRHLLDPVCPVLKRKCATWRITIEITSCELSGFGCPKISDDDLRVVHSCICKWSRIHISAARIRLSKVLSFGNDVEWLLVAPLISLDNCVVFTELSIHRLDLRSLGSSSTFGT